MLLGIAGSLVATWLLQSVGHYEEGVAAGQAASFAGAIVLLAICHFLKRRSISAR